VSGAHNFRLDSREAIDRALAGRAHLRMFPPRFEVVGALLPAGSASERQTRLDKLTDACGCGEGSAVALLALGAYLIYALTLGPSVGLWGQTWRSLVAMFVGATLGKAIGLARARLLLYRELMSLRSGMPAGADAPAPYIASTPAMPVALD
jgi:hypothetical protein